MDCSICEPTRARADKPHTFFAHEHVPCPKGDRRGEARIVLRSGQVWALLRCERCGPVEQLHHPDATAFVAAFLARGEADAVSPVDRVFKHTTSVCPHCLRLLEVEVVLREGKVYFRKDCPACGKSEALVSEDALYYVRAYGFARAGTEPLEYSQKAEHGCPTDCGVCDEHEQHTCLPIIEVTDHCNLECPICIVDNQYSWHMAPESFKTIIDSLLEAEGQCESIAISGGEPTSHPQLLELIDHANRPDVGRVMIITNGLRLGKDRKLAEELKKRGTYVGLQLDGFDAASHTIVRGRDLTEE